MRGRCVRPDALMGRLLPYVRSDTVAHSGELLGDVPETAGAIALLSGADKQKLELKLLKKIETKYKEGKKGEDEEGDE